MQVCAVAFRRALTLFCGTRDSKHGSLRKNSGTSSVLGSSNSSEELNGLWEVSTTRCQYLPSFSYGIRPWWPWDSASNMKKIHLSLNPYAWKVAEERRMWHTCSIPSSRSTRSLHLQKMLVLNCWEILLLPCTQWTTLSAIMWTLLGAGGISA